MARSEYVYVVVGPTWQPLATFTVKHELASYLRNDPGVNLKGVIRFKDNGPGRGNTGLTVMNVQKIIDGKRDNG